MTMRARAFDRWEHDQVHVVVQHGLPRETGTGGTVNYVDWSAGNGRDIIGVPENAEPPEEALLRMPEYVARVVYEALADHFGHAGHDIRALRKDYDAERARVDRLLDYATKSVAS